MAFMLMCAVLKVRYPRCSHCVCNVSAAEGLGEDAAKVVAGLERKVQESFGLELEQALEAVADGALRRAANWRIADALEQYRLATCPDAHRTVPAPPPTPPSDPSHLPEGLIDWMANAPLKVLHPTVFK